MKRIHTFRFEEDIWAKAAERADREQVTMTAVLSAALVRYGWDEKLGEAPAPVNRRPGTVASPAKAKTGKGKA